MVCRIPAVRAYLNYYRDTVYFEDAADDGTVRSMEFCPVKDFGIVFSDDEVKNVLKCGAEDIEALKVTFKQARISDVVVLGSSGVSVSNRSGMALYFDRSTTHLHPNWVIARPLKTVAGDDTRTYINLLGIHRGHRNFAHFFTDALIPLLIYLKNRRDPEEEITCLVREDLSPVQRDAFRFLSQDFPGLSFQTLANNSKIACKNTIYIVSQSPGYGRDSLLLRDYLREVRSLFLRHYGIKPASKRMRIYVSRGDAVIRKVRNEKALEQVLARYGFESYEMGKLPFDRQIELFAAAEMVVGPHGAGLINLMFCNPGTRVLEIFPDNYIIDWIALLARAGGLDYHYFIAGHGDAWRKHFSVDLAALEKQLADIFQK